MADPVTIRVNGDHVTLTPPVSAADILDAAGIPRHDIRWTMLSPVMDMQTRWRGADDVPLREGMLTVTRWAGPTPVA